jgi:fatty-acyl-CoA synthase
MRDVFPQALLKALAVDSGTPAFDHGGRVLSRRGLLDLIARFTGGLRAAGLGAGTGVALATAVTPDGFAAQIAAHVLGCRVVVVPPGPNPAQLPHILDGVEVVLADETASAALLAAAPRVLPVGPALLGAAETPVPRGEPGAIATVVYTSGSTGSPKGTEFTHAAQGARWSWHPTTWTGDVVALAERYRRFLLFGTLASAVMQEHLGLCLFSGGTAVIPGAPPVFPDVLADLRISAALLTAPRFYHLLDAVSGRDIDLSAARMLMVAGSPVAPHRLAQGYEVLGDVLHHGYGQTETGMLALQTADNVRKWPETLVSVGRPWAHGELQIRDEDGRPVPAGTAGEIWARTANILTGYRHDPGESAEVLQNGWVRTRDVGQFDARGFLYLTGRSRDVVIVNAAIHYTGPIERALASHPDVDQAYVVAAPDERTGEAAHAFVVAAAGNEPDRGALHRLVAQRLGEAAVPATITVVERVPIGPSGKPDKHALLAAMTRSSGPR